MNDEQKLDRRVQRTQKILRDALVELMLEKSYEKITIQEIIDRANVGRATFYYHYQDKDDLLLRGVAEIVSPHEEDVAVPHQPSPETNERPTFSTVGMFKHSYQNRKLQRVMFKHNRENPLLERITAFLYAQVEQKMTQFVEAGSAPDVPLPILTHFIGGGLMALIGWWHDNNFPYTAEEMDEFFQRIMRPSLRASEREDRGKS